MKKILILFSLFFISLCYVNGQIPIDRLIGFWPFNGNANDLSINNNHGTINGATLVADRFGISSRAFHFDGNDYISIPHSTTLNMQDSLSFSVWVKPESLTGTRMIFGKSNYSTKTNYLLRVKPNGYIQWEYNGYTDTDSVPLQLNTWHHIVVTASGPGQIKRIYIDNQLVKETLTSSGPFGLVTNPFTIGYASYGSEYFIGVIDDIRMYNKVLSESEIDALFNESCNSINSITETACDSYTAPDGVIYTTSGIKTAIIPNAVGCDSIITINLTINSVDVSVTQNGIILSANATADFYQWLDCNNGNSIISGETSQSFTAIQNGSYAVKVTQNGCTDTSACYAVTTVGILENTFSNDIIVYPNPTDGIVKIDLGETLTEFSVSIMDVNGKLISQSTYQNTKMFELNLNVQSGIYLLTINSENKKATIRLIKN
jgi:hypothetical protein